MLFARIWRCVKQNFAGSIVNSALSSRVLQEGISGNHRKTPLALKSTITSPRAAIAEPSRCVDRRKFIPNIKFTIFSYQYISTLSFDCHLKRLMNSGQKVSLRFTPHKAEPLVLGRRRHLIILFFEKR